MKNFSIDQDYITDVIDQKVWYKVDMKNPSPEDLVLILKDEHIRSTSTGSKDHPEFAKLRKQLGAEGYIHIAWGSWNGDSVLKPFKLNGMKFKKGEQFMCAAAMQHTYKYYLNKKGSIVHW